MNILCNGLVILGAVVLSLALLPVRGILKQLPQGATYSQWKILAGLIHIFIISYLAFTYTNWNNHNTLHDLMVPGVFFSGSIFVYIVCSLSLRTARDIMNITTLKQQSITDPLLGIYNRRYANEKLSEQITIATRYQFPLTVFILDIDFFKKVNDTYGHPNGDIVLKRLSELLLRSLRKSDILARYGGEEFIGILPNTEGSKAYELVERLRKLIAEMKIELTDEHGEITEPLNITVSIGVSAFDPSFMSEESLIHRADNALYQAKQNGRNLVVFDNINLNDSLSKN